MTANERETILSVIATLENAHKNADGRGKSTYSLGRAVPSVANQIQDSIIRLKALLAEGELEEAHATTLHTVDESGNTVTQVIAEVATNKGKVK